MSGLKDHYSDLSVKAALLHNPGNEFVQETSASFSLPSPASLNPCCWCLATITAFKAGGSSAAVRPANAELWPVQDPGRSCTDEGLGGFPLTPLGVTDHATELHQLQGLLCSLPRAQHSRRKEQRQSKKATPDRVRNSCGISLKSCFL